jgi:catechol 2,3-dioxygenase-like lactoylglutathione lyase family enzyme
MPKEISIRRIVPNIYTDDLESSKDFYRDFLGMELAMDLGWILAFASKENPKAQINIHKNREGKKLDNEAVFISIEVSDVDGLYAKAKKENREIVYDIRDEEWGVRRFFVKSPEGATVNLLTHVK